MFHTMLYRLERNQKRVLAALGAMFLVLSIIWFFIELSGSQFPMEPIVVFNGGIATLLASYWPWKPHYTDRRLSGRASIDYMSNDHRFAIGREELKFTLQFSKASDTRIYIYRDPNDIEGVALVSGACRANEVRDSSAVDFGTREIAAEEGNVVVLKNNQGNFAVVVVHDIRDATRQDDRDEVTISWVINPDRGTDFA